MFLSSFFYLILLPFKQSSNQKIISEYLRAPSYIPAFAAILCVENKQLGLRNMMARACLEIIVISPRCQAKKTVVRLHWFLTFQVLIWFPFFFFPHSISKQNDLDTWDHAHKLFTGLSEFSQVKAHHPHRNRWVVQVLPPCGAGQVLGVWRFTLPATIRFCELYSLRVWAEKVDRFFSTSLWALSKESVSCLFPDRPWACWAGRWPCRMASFYMTPSNFGG